MTCDQFKYELRKLGFNYQVSDTVITVGNIKQGNPESLGLFYQRFENLCSIDTKDRFNLSIKSEFYKLDETSQNNLFDLIFKLIRTPLNDRGDLCETNTI